MSNAQDHFLELEKTDAIDSYFDCITACSLSNEDIECVTKCVAIHLKEEEE